MIVELKRDDSLLGRGLGKQYPDAGLIVVRGAVRCVMHLEDEVGTLGDKLRHSVGPLVGRTSRCVNEEQVAGGFVGLAALIGISQRRRGERFAYWSVAQPGRIRRAML